MLFLVGLRCRFIYERDEDDVMVVGWEGTGVGGVEMKSVPRGLRKLCGCMDGKKGWHRLD